MMMSAASGPAPPTFPRGPSLLLPLSLPDPQPSPPAFEQVLPPTGVHLQSPNVQPQTPIDFPPAMMLPTGGPGSPLFSTYFLASVLCAPLHSHIKPTPWCPRTRPS